MINFETFYTANIPGLVKYASSFVSNEAAATDIAVEMLYKCWERRDLFENEEGALAYTRVMVKNKCFNYIRHIQSRICLNGTPNDSPEPYRSATDTEDFTSEVSAIMNRTIASLPEKTRRIFIMSKFDKIPQKEISEILGISQKTVEYHISQARNALKEALLEYM